VRATAQTRIVETGVDVRDGSPVRIEERIKRKPGKPRGSEDSYARTRRFLRAEPSSHIVDDELGRAGVKTPVGNVVRLFPEAANLNVPGIAFASITESLHVSD
jgi:hypothetical protein